jgi:hypothetical protein
VALAGTRRRTRGDVGGALWMGLGLLGGAVGVVIISRVLRSLLYGVAPLDPLSIAAAVALAVPVRRATRADPAASMR